MAATKTAGPRPAHTPEAPPPLAPAQDEARAVAAAAEMNGWILLRTVPLDHGGRKLVFVNDLSTPGASAPKPGVVTITVDYAGRVLRARRDISRRNFISERLRDDAPSSHAFEFADQVFRDVV